MATRHCFEVRRRVDARCWLCWAVDWSRAKSLSVMSNWSGID